MRRDFPPEKPTAANHQYFHFPLPSRSVNFRVQDTTAPDFTLSAMALAKGATA
jgi:hypothetical protein